MIETERKSRNRVNSIEEAVQICLGIIGNEENMTTMRDSLNNRSDIVEWHIKITRRPDDFKCELDYQERDRAKSITAFCFLH